MTFSQLCAVFRDNRALYWQCISILSVLVLHVAIDQMDSNIIISCNMYEVFIHKFGKHIHLMFFLYSDFLNIINTFFLEL